jgi:ribonucleoside-diphosphate reductase alpha chain
MRDQGFEFSPENGQAKKDFVPKNEGDVWEESKVQTWVVSFPIKAPDNCITRHDVTAIDQLEWYRKIQNNWCEHNQSITIYVDENEWLEVGNYVYKHFEDIVGVSFLPKDSGKYEQAPYEDITEAQYLELSRKFPRIDYNKLGEYELEDNTTGAQNLACSAGVCELP